MGRKQPQRLNFPIFSFLSHKDFIVVSGGGGRSDYGIQNKLAVYSKNSQLKDLIEEFNTGKDLIENLHSNGRVDLISCNSGRFCVLYKIDQKGHIDEVTRFVTDKDGQNTSVFNSTATLLATGGEDSTIIVWKINNNNGQITADKHLELVSHTASVENLKISEDDTLLCSASEDRTCRVFDLKTGNLVKRLTFGEENGKNLKFACCYFSLDHSHFYTIQNSLGDGPAYFTVWDMAEEFEAIKTIKIHNHAITSSCVDKTGTYMGLGTVDGCSKVLNINKLDIDCEVTAHDLIVKSVGFVNNAKHLVSVSADYSFYYLPNVRSTRWFSLILKLWFFGILLYAIALRLNEKHNFM